MGEKEGGGKQKEHDRAKSDIKREQVEISGGTRKIQYTRNTYAPMTPITCPSMSSPPATVRLPVMTTIGRRVAIT